jgi:protein-tyrosine kinase
MKERYPERFIIFDSSSLLTSADPLVFSKFIEGVLLVVEAEKTTKTDLRRALELLKGRPIVGTVLNKVKG